MRAKPWELPDGLWQRIEPLLPLRRRRYLRMVDEARSIRDLRSPPARPPGDEAALVETQTGRLQVATRGPDGTLRWQGATALSRADLIRLAGIVQQQAEPPRTTKTVRIKRVLDRDPTTANIRTVAEWEVEAPLGPDGAPDLSALPSEPPPTS